MDIGTNSQDLSFSAASNDENLVITAAESTGDSTATLTFTVQQDQNGPADITVTVDDNNGGTDSETFTLTVAAVNDPPVMAGVEAQYVDEDDT